MDEPKLTDAELVLLGLVAEMPRHGYDLEQVIAERGMREWTQIGFSSIYYVLDKLKSKGLVTSDATTGEKARKTFRVTPVGMKVLVARSLHALREPSRTYSSVLIGMSHVPFMKREDILAAMADREASLSKEAHRLAQMMENQQPLPDFVEAIFEYGIGQIEAERDWLQRTAEYMKTKPWLEDKDDRD